MKPRQPPGANSGRQTSPRPSFWKMRKCSFDASLIRRGILVKMDVTDTLEVTSAEEFRAWLQANHRTHKEIWLVIHKKSSGRPSIAYEAAVEVALCFGWIDGMLKSLDAERYAQRFTPRRPGSHWTETNLARARRLITEGRMTEAGLAVLPEGWILWMEERDELPRVRRR